MTIKFQCCVSRSNISLDNTDKFGHYRSFPSAAAILFPLVTQKK